jgi:hypothetical protein
VIEDGRTGLMAPAADAAAVAASISSILEAPNLARNLVRRGREASARFGLERLADELTDLYGELLEGQGALADRRVDRVAGWGYPFRVSVGAPWPRLTISSRARTLAVCRAVFSVPGPAHLFP